MLLAANWLTLRVRIDGPSMEPGLHRGEYALVDRATYAFSSPARGDVVVFLPREAGAEPLIKRIIAVPGDTIESRQDHVYLNGRVLAEPYATEHTNGPVRRQTLGADEYFVMGDNRLASRDSRNFGPVHRPEILGRATLIYWPLKAWSVLR